MHLKVDERLILTSTSYAHVCSNNARSYYGLLFEFWPRFPSFLADSQRQYQTRVCMYVSHNNVVRLFDCFEPVLGHFHLSDTAEPTTRIFQRRLYQMTKTWIANYRGQIEVSKNISIFFQKLLIFNTNSPFNLLSAYGCSTLICSTENPHILHFRGPYKVGTPWHCYHLRPVHNFLEAVYIWVSKPFSPKKVLAKFWTFNFLKF